MSDQSSPSAQSRALFFLLAALLVCSPFFRAGGEPLASLALQLLAIPTLLLSLWSPAALRFTPLQAAAAASLILIPVIYLIPLPADWVDELPGRELYRQGFALLNAGDAGSFKPLSTQPHATLATALAMLPPLAVFLGVRRLDHGGCLLLVHLLLGIAVLQAILGLIQYGSAQSGSTLFAVADGHTHSATGTYPNRNHLGGLFEMTLPLALALLLSAAGRGLDRANGERDRWRRRAAFLSSHRGGAAIAYAIVSTVLLVGVIFTRSRAGITLTMLGLVLATLLFAGRIGGRNVYGPTGTLVAIALGFGTAIGLAPVIARFSMQGLLDDNRIPLFSATLTGIGEWLPMGSGPGTYPHVFPAFQPLELGQWFVNRAHNDYLETLFTSGVLGGALIAFGLALYLAQWVRLIRERNDRSPSRFLQIGAGIGLLLVALHEFVDYNLHTPANQVVFALLAGLFFLPPHHLDRPVSRRHSLEKEPHPGGEIAGQSYEIPAAKMNSHRTSLDIAGGMGSPSRPVTPQEQIPNPFLDPFKGQSDDHAASSVRSGSENPPSPDKERS